LVSEGAIGAPKLLRCRTGNGLLNNGSHGIDLLRYLLSDPDAEWVAGQVGRSTDRRERGGRIEEFAVGVVGFPGDVQALLETDLPGAQKFYPLVVGESGTLESRGDHLRLINEHGLKLEQSTQDEGDHAAEIRAMVSWVRGGTEHRSEARHGRHAIEILMALYESARLRRRIPLPFTGSESPLEAMIDAGAFEETSPPAPPL
jgi:predicted dehydrogenase